MESQTVEMPVPKSVIMCVDVLTKLMKSSTTEKVVDLFEGFVKEVRDNVFKKEGSFCPVVFMIFRDYEKFMWKAGCYPLLPIVVGGSQELTMSVHGATLKKLIKEVKEADSKKMQLVGVIKVSDSYFKRYEKKEVFNPNGTLKEGITRPKDHPDSLDALQFELEEIFVKHTKAYEYIQSDDGELVFRSEPLIDTKSAYNEIEDRHSKLGFLFTEGTPLN